MKVLKSMLQVEVNLLLNNGMMGLFDLAKTHE